jgi:hypothetical protein
MMIIWLYAIHDCQYPGVATGGEMETYKTQYFNFESIHKQLNIQALLMLS